MIYLVSKLAVWLLLTFVLGLLLGLLTTTGREE